MLFFSNKIELTVLQVLLNTQATSYFEDTQYFSTVCNIKGQDHNLHISWVLILRLAIIRDLLRNLAVFLLSIESRLNVLYCSSLNVFCMASWWCAEHSAELALSTPCSLCKAGWSLRSVAGMSIWKSVRGRKNEKHLWSWYWQEGLWAVRELLVARVQKKMTANWYTGQVDKNIDTEIESKQLSLAVWFLLYLRKQDFLSIILWINIIQEMLCLSLRSFLNRNKSHNPSLH